MRWKDFAWYELLLCVLISIVGQVYIHYYPNIRGCHWPNLEDTANEAEFRLLTFADPQIEGDTKAVEGIRGESVLGTISNLTFK
jgi:hypothetical protein